MKILVIIVSNEFNSYYSESIKILNDYLTNNFQNQYIIDYCGISSNDDFSNYEHIIHFKYKIINNKYQLSKICDFISDNINTLDYDWYIKTRPEVKLLEQINFKILSNTSINARARVYRGPKQIIHGMSVNGSNDIWKNVGDCFFDIQ